MFVENNAERHVIKALRLFDTIPYDLMERFLVCKNNYAEYKPKETLITLRRLKAITYSTNDKCYRLIGNIPKQIDKICCFAVYLHFARSVEAKVYFADYPFDYIFEDNHRLFQLINYSDEGRYKLNFRRNMLIEKEVDPYSTIPVIMLINGKTNPFINGELMGDKSFIPKEDYYIANVSYKVNPGELDEISVTATKYKGGTTDEYQD